MRVLLQRVTQASVSVESQVVGKCGLGLLLFVGIGHDDTSSKLAPMAKKLSELRIFPDEDGKFDRSLLDIGGEVLAVSQFTLYADTAKGRRPGFSDAAPPAEAEKLFETFLGELKHAGIQRVRSGVFGAHMHVSLENDGPVTIMLES
jgi:D-aminoacyl-tRNA deacylase